MKNHKKLSVALAVYNEEKHLRACLESVSDIADELVIVDGGSKDRTIAIAREFTDIVIKTSNPKIFHINKQKALDRCSHPWILQMDADEVVTPQLAKEIEDAISAKKPHDGYYIPRQNYFGSTRMRYGGTYPDTVIRLVRNGKASFPCKSVHEQIAVNGTIGSLRNALHHYPYQTVQDYWSKADVYTSLTAQELHKQNVPKSFSKALKYFIHKPLSTFFSLYIRQKGYLDGWWGVLWAYGSALHHAQAYAKYLKL